MTTLQILQAARALIEAGWGQGFDRKTLSGGPTTYCIVGALQEVVGAYREPHRWLAAVPARNALRAPLPRGCPCLPTFNDHPRTTKRRVLALFDRALIAVTK